MVISTSPLRPVGGAASSLRMITMSEFYATRARAPLPGMRVAAREEFFRLLPTGASRTRPLCCMADIVNFVALLDVALFADGRAGEPAQIGA
jgi:hypothetical protein